MLTSIVLTKNEEKNIIKCLKSLLWSDEIIIIDDYSTDSTINLAKSLKNKKIKIFERKLNSDFSLQRNFGLQKAKKGWVLFIDSDEIVSKELKFEIEKITTNTESTYSGFFIKRQDFFLKKKLQYGETGNIEILRLAKNDAGKWKRKVHEYLDIHGEVGHLKSPILHYPHASIREFIEDINTYSTIHAKENEREGKKKALWKIIIYPSGKFVVNYFFKLGFLDGVEGFIFAVLMSFHSFLSWSKQWTR